MPCKPMGPVVLIVYFYTRVLSSSSHTGKSIYRTRKPIKTIPLHSTATVSESAVSSQPTLFSEDSSSSFRLAELHLCSLLTSYSLWQSKRIISYMYVCNSHISSELKPSYEGVKICYLGRTVLWHERDIVHLKLYRKACSEAKHSIINFIVKLRDVSTS